MNIPKPERTLEAYLEKDLVRDAYSFYARLSERIRRTLVGTPIFQRLYYALSTETSDGNLARLLENDYYSWRREKGQ